ncbi:MAG: RICIN domain-containing protein [Bacteroidales bacterium]|jgi:hypothetical protein|nr:RICIN domain-containing protein [Bacteroidales bacterium]
MKAAFIILLVLISIPTVIFGPRIHKDIQKKRNYANTYAIQNIGNGKDIRVRDAGNSDGTKMILYSHHNWECITWQLIELGDNIYLLKNLYTQKSFQPSSVPAAGVTLWQQTLGGSRLQYWEFVKQPGDSYLIRLKDTELYLTSTSDENDSDIVLMPEQDSDKQRWRLIRQNPII